VLAALEVGTLAQYLTLCAIIVGAFFVWRGGGGSALSILTAANGVLEARVRELEHKQRDDAKLIAELTGRTDVTLALSPLTKSIDGHEQRAQARFDRTLVVLELIASRLGPDNGHQGE